MQKACLFVCSLVSVLFLSAHQVSAAEPVILQMADGRFYCPQLGLTTATREEILSQLGLTTTTVPIVAPVVPPAEPTVLVAVKRAQAELQARIDAEKPAKPLTAKTDTGWRGVTLAVWDKNTDAIEYVKAQKKGSDLKFSGDHPNIGVSWAAGIYSEYKSSDPAKAVVAIRYPQYLEKSKKLFEIREVVYTPSSAGLRTPEVVAAGREVMDGFIDGAYDDLDARNVRSRAVAGKRVADVIDPRAAKAVIIIEHLDDQDLIHHATSSLEKIYAGFALNREKTFAYTQSGAGARGLVQFMPTSYKRFAASRPDLGLEPDFDKAMGDAKNAIKAEVAYLDALLASMPDSALANASTDPHVPEFAVASYNAGPARVIKALPQWDVMWSGQDELRQQQIAKLQAQVEPLRKKILAEDDDAVWKPLQKKLNNIRAEIAGLKGKTKTPPLKKETLEYLKKYRLVLPYLSSPNQTSSV